MASTVELEIITPERIVMAEDIEMIVVTAVDGELGIMPNHYPLITGLKISVARVLLPGAEQWKPLAIAGGLLEVLPYKISIVVPSAELAEEIDTERALAAKKRAEKRLATKSDSISKTRAEISLQRALTRLKAAQYNDK